MLIVVKAKIFACSILTLNLLPILSARHLHNRDLLNLYWSASVVQQELLNNTRQCDGIISRRQDADTLVVMQSLSSGANYIRLSLLTHLKTTFPIAQATDAMWKSFPEWRRLCSFSCSVFLATNKRQTNLSNFYFKDEFKGQTKCRCVSLVLESVR